MISFLSRGSFKNTEKFLGAMQRLNLRSIVEPYAQEGVRALESATPVDTGRASRSWGYEIRQTRRGVSIIWTNDDIENGFPVAIMLQYGHATRNGGFVAGRDYINPAIRPIFDKIADDVWKAVRSS